MQMMSNSMIKGQGKSVSGSTAGSTRSSTSSTLKSYNGRGDSYANYSPPSAERYGQTSDKKKVEDGSDGMENEVKVGETGEEVDQDSPTSFRSRERACKRLNEQLELRSKEIFDKIKLFNERSVVGVMLPPMPDVGGGDAPEIPMKEIMDLYSKTCLSSPRKSTTEESTPRSKPSLMEKSQSLDSGESFVSGGSARSLKTSKSKQSISISSLISSAADKAISEAAASSIAETDSVQTKARSRLHKATESVVKCLQSKLVNYEGRLADLHIQFRQKIQENTMLESKIRALEEDRERLLKSLSNLQNCSEKYSKAADLAKTNLNLKMQAFAALKKDIDLLRKEQRQKATTIQTLQTKLNRCVEENDRLKLQSRSTTSNLKDKQHEDRSIIDELQQRVCQLEQQKNILNATIGKQSTLIRTLRTQRVNNQNKNPPIKTFNSHSPKDNTDWSTDQ